MHICLVENGLLPVSAYGGTERVVWYLAAQLHQLGHRVTLLCKPGSSCPFARVLPLNSQLPLAAQIPTDCDIAHLHFPSHEQLPIPAIITNHGNRNSLEPFPLNTVFLSKNHASRYGSETFVHNGLDWDDYGKPILERPLRRYAHFLGNAAWRVKNVQGAMAVARKAQIRLMVLGGKRLNLKMGFRFTLDPRVHFCGMVGGTRKLELLRNSSALLFPVRWHEPFGLAVIESMYFGCPVFATPYGALPELVDEGSGTLSSSAAELAYSLKHSNRFSRGYCHERARELFHARRMTMNYLVLYERVLNGESLNSRNPVLQTVQEEKFLPWNQ
ncbi:MAG: glycosyltransferase [Bacteroidetes bacterium]|nr:glycosyltransferase [Bacteroidota bacterium]